MWTIIPLVVPESQISSIGSENKRGWNSEEKELTPQFQQDTNTKNNLQNNFPHAFK